MGFYWAQIADVILGFYKGQTIELTEDEILSRIFALGIKKNEITESDFDHAIKKVIIRKYVRHESYIN